MFHTIHAYIHYNRHAFIFIFNVFICEHIITTYFLHGLVILKDIMYSILI